MNFDLSENELMIQQMVKDFAEREIRPNVMKWDESQEFPVELFKKHPGRFPLCHIKDLDAEFKNILPVGEGVVNYKRIFEAAKSGGLEHFFVEHDFPKDAFESLRISKKALDIIL